ncbi:lipoprotein insertase outer membrane protein LolB [Ramlibacter sp. PS4R-6]|uniref:lipoprotein insertase outer membrane protein LolB n=1 Tax=Ramlibacter sp. PS4R-6 TaxID=3133438 RepID=UPI0030B5A6C7
MKLHAPWRAAGAALLALLLSACATAPKPPAEATAEMGPWAGRLALTVQDKPNESFAAGFELKGNPQRGELELLSPLGGTLGLLQWQPGKATLRSSSRTTEYESLEALVTQVAGTSIPVAALFDWLRGVATPVPGWQPDLTQLAQGRLRAVRTDPQPQADLRVLLER